jgi:hypothetical protein
MPNAPRFFPAGSTGLSDLSPAPYVVASRQQTVRGQWPGARADVSSDPGLGLPRAPTASWYAGCRAAVVRGVGCWRWSSGAARGWANSGRRGRRRRRLLAGAGPSPRTETGALPTGEKCFRPTYSSGLRRHERTGELTLGNPNLL